MVDHWLVVSERIGGVRGRSYVSVVEEGESGKERGREKEKRKRNVGVVVCALLYHRAIVSYE